MAKLLACLGLAFAVCLASPAQPMPTLHAGMPKAPTRFEPDPPPYREETGAYRHAFMWHPVGAPSVRSL